MEAGPRSGREFTWSNPVWPGSMPDPFVLRAEGAWYAYGTGAAADADGLRDGRQFTVLRSDDFARWEFAGGALAPLSDPAAVSYWAPEVCAHDGRYLMYYSAGGHEGDGHRLRVAVASRPEGPFEDAEVTLVPDEPFSIDAHPFRDPADGRWYLFFAKDYFDGRAGTGVAGVRLSSDLLSVDDRVFTAARATDDWQVYQRRRTWYGRTWDAWHTVEGPTVLAHGGRYWCLYSGGNWKSATYGVGVAVADRVTGPYVEADGGPGPAVLRATPACPGPGHCSVVVGPDGVTPFLVYHAWDLGGTRRRMHMDPLVWTVAGPRCDGPSVGPRTVTLP